MKTKSAILTMCFILLLIITLILYPVFFAVIAIPVSLATFITIMDYLFHKNIKTKV